MTHAYNMCVNACVHARLCVCMCVFICLCPRPKNMHSRDVPVAYWKVTLFHVVATRRSTLRIKFLVSCAGLMSDLVRLCSLSFACPLCGYVMEDGFHFLLHPVHLTLLTSFPPVVRFAFGNNELFMRYSWKSIGSLIVQSCIMYAHEI